MKTKPEQSSVLDFTKFRAQAEVKKLYRQHENSGDPHSYLLESLSARGRSLVDDVSFFLSHPEMREEFEQVLSENLRAFSIQRIKEKS